jgi:pyridoxal phosphate enzyme (YggS family)
MSDAEKQESNSEAMRIDPSRAKVLVENIEQVIKRVDAARGSRKVRSYRHMPFCNLPILTACGLQVRLIAVSKLKPATDILALHQSPLKITHFGENYSNELTEKAGLLPRTIKWHMIGGLQTNKCKPLAEQVPNLFCVSSVDTAKKADALEKGRSALAEKETLEEKLRVLVQINTSGEESKSGVEPGEAAVELCRHVKEKCPSLKLAGLMTIGAIARSQAASTEEGRNEDFVTLTETRDNVAKALGMEKEELELGMGMSADFEAAIAQGSDEVRIGTTIFGERPAKQDAKIV